MKKQFMLALAMTGALALALGLAACGGGNNHDKVPETSDSEVTADEWKTIMTDTHNYTVTYSTTFEDEIMQQVNKVDGDKYEYNFEAEGQYCIVERTGDKSDPHYTAYRKKGTEWNLESGSHAEESIMIFNYDEVVLSLLKDDFANFTYSEDKYTCASLTTPDWLYTSWKDVTVTFEDGALVSLTADVSYDEGDAGHEPLIVHMELSSVGTTTVAIPTLAE